MAVEHEECTFGSAYVMNGKLQNAQTFCQGWLRIDWNRALPRPKKFIREKQHDKQKWIIWNNKKRNANRATWVRNDCGNCCFEVSNRRKESETFLIGETRVPS